MCVSPVPSVRGRAVRISGPAGATRGCTGSAPGSAGSSQGQRDHGYCRSFLLPAEALAINATAGLRPPQPGTHKGKLLTQSEGPLSGTTLSLPPLGVCGWFLRGGGGCLGSAGLRAEPPPGRAAPLSAASARPSAGKEPGTVQTAALLRGSTPSSLPSSVSPWSPCGYLAGAGDQQRCGGWATKVLGGTTEAPPWQAAAVAGAGCCVCERATGTSIYCGAVYSCLQIKGLTLRSTPARTGAVPHRALPLPCTAQGWPKPWGSRGRLRGGCQGCLAGARSRAGSQHRALPAAAGAGLQPGEGPGLSTGATPPLPAPHRPLQPAGVGEPRERLCPGRGCHEILCCFNSRFKALLEQFLADGPAATACAVTDHLLRRGLAATPAGAEVPGQPVLEPETRGPAVVHSPRHRHTHGWGAPSSGWPMPLSAGVGQGWRGAAPPCPAPAGCPPSSTSPRHRDTLGTLPAGAAKGLGEGGGLVLQRQHPAWGPGSPPRCRDPPLPPR